MNIKDRKKTQIIILFIMFFLCFKVFSINNKVLESINLNNKNIEKYVYPLGNVVGIKATTDGVLVVGYEDDDVEYIGSIQKGDNIVEINNQKIENINQVNEILQNTKENKVNIVFERDKEYKSEVIKLKKENGKNKLGLWVRDKISGIGTLTFYDPQNANFKAIGHPITDVDTNELLRIKEGNIYDPSYIEIIKSNENKVGYIKGDFNTEKPIGKFFDNTNFGISGEIIGEKNSFLQLIKVGHSKDIKLGKAYILFEDKNRNIRTYDINIEEIFNNKKYGNNMKIKVVDKELINLTGGIVQGMSGAPIIQDNKIIGAVTHVSKDNPKNGYGIFIDEMIELDRKY